MNLTDATISVEKVLLWYKVTEEATMQYQRQIKMLVRDSLPLPEAIVSAVNVGGEIEDLLAFQRNELEILAVFDYLSALEALFCKDYQIRVNQKLKDPLSRHFRDIAKTRKDNDTRLGFEKDILSGWKEHAPQFKDIVSKLISVFKYRHWVAHGRYWLPKLGSNKYDFFGIVYLFETFTNEFPFECE
ncbi:MAG: hypothetical protein HZB85_03845 [Deltaproteobacteria bacterium]|nr:hypothetical protein [Deltaproteobacteria bacterium]